MRHVHVRTEYIYLIFFLALNAFSKGEGDVKTWVSSCGLTSNLSPQPYEVYCC